MRFFSWTEIKSQSTKFLTHDEFCLLRDQVHHFLQLWLDSLISMFIKRNPRPEQWWITLAFQERKTAHSLSLFTTDYHKVLSRLNNASVLGKSSGVKLSNLKDEGKGEAKEGGGKSDVVEFFFFLFFSFLFFSFLCFLKRQRESHHMGFCCFYCPSTEINTKPE